MIEEELFDKLKNILITKYGENISVSSEFCETPPTFPAISIVMSDYSNYTQMADSHSINNADVVTFDINVYSIKPIGKKFEAKDIMSAIDDVMCGLGFNRTFQRPLPNEDRRVYRIFSRYNGVVTKDNTIYRR